MALSHWFAPCPRYFWSGNVAAKVVAKAQGRLQNVAFVATVSEIKPGSTLTADRL